MTASSSPAAELLDGRAAAALCGCSARHLARLAENGQAPAPRKLGRLVRWSRADLESWIMAGCPAMTKGGAA